MSGYETRHKGCFIWIDSIANSGRSVVGVLENEETTVWQLICICECWVWIDFLSLSLKTIYYGRGNAGVVHWIARASQLFITKYVMYIVHGSLFVWTNKNILLNKNQNKLLGLENTIKT